MLRMFVSLFVASCFLFLGSNALFFVYRDKKKIGLVRIIIQNIILFISSFITLYFYYKVGVLIAEQNQVDAMSDILIVFTMMMFFSLLIIFTAGKQKLSIKRFLVVFIYAALFYVAMYIQYMIIKS